MRIKALIVVLPVVLAAACGTTHKTVVVNPPASSTTIVNPPGEGSTTVVDPSGDDKVVKHDSGN